MSRTVDDSSPELWYVGASWLTDHKDDGQTNLYSNATYHSSTKDGDYVQIKWKGTDITVYGSRRDNHGVYGVTLDGGVVQYYSGYSSNPQFQQALYATDGLQNGVHTLQLINSNARNVAQYPNYLWLDIDYVSFSGTILNADPNAPAVPVVPTSTSQTQPPPPPTSTPSVVSSSSPSPPPSTVTSLSSITILTTPTTTPPSSSSTTTPSIISSSRPSSDSSTGLIPHFSTPSSIPTSPGSHAPTGSPTTPPSSEVVSDGSAEKADHKTTTIGVSVTIIVVALVISASIIGGWWWRRRKRQREEEEDAEDYLAPQSSWR